MFSSNKNIDYLNNLEAGSMVISSSVVSHLSVLFLYYMVSALYIFYLNI